MPHAQLSRPVDWGLLTYAGVIGFQPTPTEWESLARAADWRKGTDRFKAAYWSARREYDRGNLSTNAFWARLGVRAKAAELPARLDVAMWLRPDPRAVRALATARGRGTRLALLCSAPVPLARRLEATTWARSLFERLIFSCDVGISMPQEEALARALVAIGVPHPRDGQVVVVDDREENCLRALAMGLDTHWYRGNPADLAGALRRPQTPQPPPGSRSPSTPPTRGHS